MAEINDIADAVVGDLNTQISGLGATRQYTVDLDRKDLTAQVVYVVPSAERNGLASRWSNQREFDLQVVVLRPVTLGTSAGKTDMDAAMTAVDNIKALFGQDGALRDTQQSGATWTGLTHFPLWDQERLKAGRFATQVTLTYMQDM